MIHVYAVTDKVGPALSAAGIDGARVEMLPVAALGVAVSRHDRSIGPSTEAVVAHASVCDQLLARGGAVLPVRFGARYSSDADVETAILEQCDAFVASLDRVRGRVEIGVRAAWAEEQVAEDDSDDLPLPDSGRDYLERRLAQEQRRDADRQAAERASEALHQSLAARADDARLKVLATPGLVLSAAYLVPAGSVDAFTEAVEEVAGHRTDLQVVCTGPWPPYNFVGGEVLV